MTPVYHVSDGRLTVLELIEEIGDTFLTMERFTNQRITQRIRKRRFNVKYHDKSDLRLEIATLDRNEAIKLLESQHDCFKRYQEKEKNDWAKRLEQSKAALKLSK